MNALCSRALCAAALAALFAPYAPLRESLGGSGGGGGAVEKRLYFNLLHVQPIKANLSFAMVPESADAVYAGLNPLRLLLQLMQSVDPPT